MDVDVVIVGGGLAGLTAACEFEKAGRSWVLLEQSSRLGGRVGTDIVDGWLCDRGFQVFLPSYPTAAALLDYQHLHLVAYPRGAVIYDPNATWFGLPIAYPSRYQFGQRLSISLMDYFKMGLDVIQASYPQLMPFQTSLNDYLDARFSSLTAHSFLKPFFRGVFLDSDLKVSPETWRYYLRLFLLRGAAVPSQGMQAIPDQLASRVPNHSIRMNVSVESIEPQCVHLRDGGKISTHHILLAVDQPSAFHLSGVSYDLSQSRPVHTLYFCASQLHSLGPLNLLPKASLCQQLSVPTLIADSYSPNNRHLIMTTSRSKQGADPDAVMDDLRHFLGDQVDTWQHLHTYSSLYNLPRFVPPPTRLDGIFYAGDWMRFGSIEGAIRSGLDGATAILRQ